MYNVIGMWGIRLQRGFTLIELLVTVAMVAALSAGVLTLIGQGPRQTARDGRRAADLEQIASALELFRNDQARYPGPTWTGDLTGGSYLTAVPTDPVSGGNYTYTPAPAGCTTAGTRCTTYSLCATREKVLPLNFCITNP